MWQWIWQRGVTGFEEMTNLPKATREMLAEAFRFDRLTEYLSAHSDFEPQITWGGASFCVMVQYRRYGRALVSLFPERGGMSLVLVYGCKEQEAFEAARDGFAPGLAALFDMAQVYPDGRWLLIAVDNDALLPGIGRMIAIKKKPRRK